MADDLKFSAPNFKDPGLPAPFGLLVDRAIEIIGRHWRLFALVTMATLVMQAILYFFVRTTLGATLAAYGMTPIVTALANIQCAADLRNQNLGTRKLFSWVLGRLWAVILIDFVFYFAFNVGAIQMFFPGSDPARAILGVTTAVLTTTMALADVYASVEPQPNWLLTLPLAFMRSIALSWQNANLLRILALGVFLIAELLVTVMLEQVFTLRHVPAALFLADVPLSTILAAPFATLFTVVYFDCLAREKSAT